MLQRRTTRRFWQIAALIAVLILAACGGPDTPSAVTNLDGLARVQTGGATMDFQVSSGDTGEHLPGIQISVASVGGMRLIFAEDPTGTYLAVAAPLAGQATVRRIVIPPQTAQGYNIATAAGQVNIDALEALGPHSETDLRARLGRGPDQAVLLYLYNPANPLALTGATLEVFGTPFDNVFFLSPGPDLADNANGLVIAALDRDAYGTWANIIIDRYLASRIGQPPAIDLRDDLAFQWSYPVFAVFPPEESITLGEGASAALSVTWRSVNPDPPPPWSFFVTSDNEAVTVSPENFTLDAETPPQEIAITINREGLSPGQHSATVFIQPFSETFGMIDQRVQRVITFTVSEATPTPTPGPAVESLTLSPESPQTGGALSITASGFAPGETVQMTFVGPEYRQTDSLSLADALGNFTYEIDLAAVPPGDYTLTLLGAQSGVRGEAAVTVAPAPPDAVVASNELNLRLEPFSESPVLEVLVNGDQLDIVAVNGDDSWLEVISPTGTRGWVLSRLCIINIDLSTVPWNPAYPAPSPN